MLYLLAFSFVPNIILSGYLNIEAIITDRSQVGALERELKVAVQPQRDERSVGHYFRLLLAVFLQ